MPKMCLKSRVLWFALILALGCWVLWTATVTDIDYSDGYIAIANSQYLAGIIPEYFGQRGPLLAFLLIPAELFANAHELHPLDIRPHHFLMALIHISYLAITALLLMRICGCRIAVWLAYVISIPGYIFFSYTPFINHDIFPGAILLAMLYVADRYINDKKKSYWLLLIALGYIAALTKHTYAIFWIAILLSRAGLLLGFRWERKNPITWWWLLLGAFVSGLLTWLTYAWVLEGSIAHVPFILRPYFQIVGIKAQYAASDLDNIFEWWLYWRNFPLAYGIVVSILIIPALYMALKYGKGLQRSAAITWLLCICVMQLIEFKEVRYLAYLTPLTALLLVPVIDKLISSSGNSRYKVILAGLFVIDILIAGSAVIHGGKEFYRNAVVSGFLKPLEQYPDAQIVLSNPLSFSVDEGYVILKGDRYHRIFHVTDEIIQRLYRYPENKVRKVKSFEEINKISSGDLLLFSSNVLVRGAKEYTPLSQSSDQGIRQFVALSVDRDSLASGQLYMQYEYNKNDKTYRFTPYDSKKPGAVFMILDPGSG